MLHRGSFSINADLVAHHIDVLHPEQAVRIDADLALLVVRVVKRVPPIFANKMLEHFTTYFNERIL